MEDRSGVCCSSTTEPQGDWLEGTVIVFGWNLLWDSPGAFQPLCRTVKVASHLPTDLRSSSCFFHYRGGLKSAFAENIARDSTLDVNQWEVALSRHSSVHPPAHSPIHTCTRHLFIHAALAECSPSVQQPSKAVGVLRSLEASVPLGSWEPGHRMCCVQETFDLGFHTFLNTHPC